MERLCILFRGPYHHWAYQEDTIGNLSRGKKVSIIGSRELKSKTKRNEKRKIEGYIC
jgi:hypothetical protein